eukprot:TRINITY_DN105903_c0_g1_i1.p1 TRINITY_DN105903_c0_g1~~TRINITY_DN105903_c0_g1_i1.p1  ORF type:complete len:249 (-),score=92.29 TRINITY_DN105903_c0_g1_i1:51-797(-)
MMNSSSADPFDVAKDHVEAAVRKVRQMQKEWHRLLETENTAESSSFKDLEADLRSELTHLGEDLAEVETSIRAVESNREQFPVSDETLAARKDFLAASHAAVSDVRSSISSTYVQAKLEDDRKRLLLKKQRQAEEDQQRHLAQESKAFLEEQRMLQKQLIAQQEDELDAIGRGAQRLGQVAATINGELASQQQLLEELNQDIDKEMERMDAVTKGMAKLLKTSNKGQIYAVGGAILLFVILVFLILNT